MGRQNDQTTDRVGVGGASRVSRLRVGAAVLLVVAALVAAWFHSREHYLVFHTFVELAGVAVGAGVFLLVWAARGRIDNDAVVLLGLFYLFVGILDAFHTLSYQGFGILVPADDVNAATQFWIAARGLETLGFVAFVVLYGRRLRFDGVVALLIVTTAALVFSILHVDLFPDCYVSGQGLTPFKVGAELSFVVIRGAVIVGIYLRRRRLERVFRRLVMLALLLSLGAEIVFSTYSDVDGLTNFVGHAQRLASNLIIYAALIHRGIRQPHSLLDQRLSDTVEALRESERRLETLLGNLPGMAYRCRNDRDWTMAFVSEGSLALTGYAPDELEEKRVVAYADVIHPDDREMVWDSIQKRLPMREAFQLTYRIRTRSGEERWVWEQGRGVFDNGDLLALEGFIIDITDRKRVEAERLEMERRALENQKLEGLGLLAGGIAHDFNNILSAILGYGELAEGELTPGHPARASLDEVRNAGLRAAELVHQMLAFSGQAPFVLQRHDLSEAVRGIARLLESSVSKYVTVTYDLSDGLPPVEVDAGQLQQVIMNLVVNASEAIGERPGTVQVSTELRPAGRCPSDDGFVVAVAPEGGLPPGPVVSLSVSDDGCGMDEKTRRRVFEPFYTTKFLGRGLGMAAVRGIVRQHRGAVVIKTASGEGTTVVLCLPLARVSRGETPPPPALPTEDDQAPSSLARRFLVVDDEEPLRDLARAVLEGIGCRVDVAGDGIEALQMLEEHAGEIDGVLLDVTMPVMDGRACLREIRARYPDMPVLLMSGYEEDVVLESLEERRIQGFVPKPFLAGRLREAVSAVFDGACSDEE